MPKKRLIGGLMTTALVCLASVRSSLGGGIDSGETVDIITNTIIAAGAYFGILSDKVTGS